MDDGDEDLFGAAYENMVYRDSTADDIDADMMEGPQHGGDSDDELDREQQRLSGRLAFLALLATLWKIVALQAAAEQTSGCRDFQPVARASPHESAAAVAIGGRDRPASDCRDVGQLRSPARL